VKRGAFPARKEDLAGATPYEPKSPEQKSPEQKSTGLQDDKACPGSADRDKANDRADRGDKTDKT
jgi:hypothetical protein